MDLIYWFGIDAHSPPAPTFGKAYPVYVYGNYYGNQVYPYVNAYENYLESIGVRSASLTLISLEDTVNLLKCKWSSGTCTDCTTYPYVSWINKGFHWWVGTANNMSVAVMDKGVSKFQWELLFLVLFHLEFVQC